MKKHVLPNDGISHCVTERLIFLLRDGTKVELKTWITKGGWQYWVMQDNQLANNDHPTIAAGGGIKAKFHIKYRNTGHVFYNNFTGKYPKRVK